MRKQLAGYLSVILLISAMYGLALSGTIGQAGTTLNAGTGQAGTTLKDASVTVTGYWTIRYSWTIDKSVTPETWSLFDGDSGTSLFTITVTKDRGTVEAWVEGKVCVTNGGDVATENLKIVVVLRNGYPPPKDILAVADVNVSSNPVLDPGETGCYYYRVNIPISSTQPRAGGTYKVTANITITNHSGHLGEPFGPEPSETTVFPSGPTLINDKIRVNDTYGGSWLFSGNGSVNYEKTFTCAHEGENENIAKIVETGQSDNAVVTVKCYKLEVTKTAETSFTRNYSWTIYKKGNVTSLKLDIGKTSNVLYNITVDATYTDSDWAVSGTITVHNPAPIPVTIISIADVVSPGINATVDFEVTFPYELKGGEKLIGKYSASLPDDSPRVNEAKVTIQNYHYKWNGTKTEAGTTDFSGTVKFNFSSATMREVDGEIAVNDTFIGDLGTVTYEEAPKTFTYIRTIGPYSIPGTYTVENTASFLTCNTSKTGRDSWIVTVNVPSAVEYRYETAYGKGDEATCFIPTFNNWGWTNRLPGYGEYTFELWAAAGQCDTSKGILVGTVIIKYDSAGLYWDVKMAEINGVPCILEKVHVYAGIDMFPRFRGRQTVAPGLYEINLPTDNRAIYVIWHAVVGIPYTP